MLYKVVLNFKSVDHLANYGVLSSGTTLTFSMLQKVILTFESVDEALKRPHSNEAK